MGARSVFRLTAKRMARGDRTAPVSAFTAVLLIFGLLFWTTNMWSVVHSRSQCHFSEFWLAGWFDGRSTLQNLGAVIALIAALFVIRTISLALWRRTPIETIAQGYFILWLVIVFLGLKAQILPYAFPSQALLHNLFQYTHPMRARLDEERAAVTLAPWPYDYPEPPPHPWDLPWPKSGELFASTDSPLWSEYKTMLQCRADYDAARKAYDDWREGFHDYLQREGWKYR